jgi:hypothetical protein
MHCLPKTTRQVVLSFSSHVPTQAQYINHMATASAFRQASSHDYFSTRNYGDNDDDALPFAYSDGGDTCFDSDVVRLVTHILNDRSDVNGQNPMGWDVILAQLQQCHVTFSGTFWTSIVSSSVAQTMSPICR